MIRTAVTISVGDELLAGETLDTHGRHLAGTLAARGCRVLEHRVEGDDVDAIAAAIRDAANRVGLVVITGGLGPTLDDVSRDAVARAMKSPLVEDAAARRDLEAWYAGRRRPMPTGNLRQTLRPEAAICLANPNGTAPGLQGRIGETEIVVLPGPPREMHPMFERVLDSLPLATPRPMIVVRASGIGESDAASLIESLMERDNDLPVATTVSQGVLSARIRGRDEGDRGRIETMASTIEAAWRPFVFGRGDVTLAETVGIELARADLTLATAESCTGGMIGGAITDVAGSSAWYRGGWVTYENRRKIEDLGVDPFVIERDGAVSKAVVAAMAVGAAKRAGADLGIATSGIAGPDGGSADKPVGTVWIAVSHAGDVEARCFRFPGDRGVVRSRTVAMALQMIRFRATGVEASLLWERTEVS